jgi:hypothetical protein
MAQKKLYEARELMEKAMMTLPGASLFLDRQAHAGGTTRHPSLFPHMADISVPSLKGKTNKKGGEYVKKRRLVKLMLAL